MAWLYSPLTSFSVPRERRGGEHRPMRSALLGMLAASQGITRDEADRLAAIEHGYGVAVRVDAAGTSALGNVINGISIDSARLNTVGGTMSTSTPLLMAFWPSFEAAAAVLKHIAQPWLNAGAAHAESINARMAARSFISLPAR